MEHIPISKFKANCAAVVEKVGTSGKGVVITRHGKPVAQLLPPAVDRPKKRKLGCMEGTLDIVGDIINTSDLWDPEETVREWDELMARPRKRRSAGRAKT